MIKRAAAINDLSGLGRCSLTIALPVLSALGVQCCPVPTAVLSSQTDGYRDYTFTDLTDTLPEYIAHWKANGEQFDAIYTGFLGSARQIKIVSDFIDSFRREKTLVLVDPVMGDNGAMYDSVDRSLCDGIRELVRHADIITPNLTEAAILLGEEEIPEEEETWLSWSRRLCALGPKAVAITGIDNGDGRMCVACCEGERTELIYTVRVAKDYPGAGDLFASVLLGKLLRGSGLHESASEAAAFVAECAELTYKMNTPAREGLIFEPMLHRLIK
ncbi:MAG: pyridoxamine kinase [Clostridiaceae bacterium]|nr:pyridoxamine kinase [Clostridiaceae bacterium]